MQTRKAKSGNKRIRVTRSTKTNWIIAIPSYKRAETLKEKTLATLSHYKINPALIHVFVANKEEYDTYKAALDPKTYGHLHIAIPGMAAVRNYITRFFPKGKAIFNMDDDIRGFLEWSPKARRHERPLQDLKAVISTGFATLRKEGLRLFGFYPVSNGFFMKDGYTTDLRYIIGSVWGILNPGPVLTVTIDDKEDYLRSVMMYLLDGGVVRFSCIAPQSAYYKEEGGMQEERTMSRIDGSARAMVAAFPDLVTLNLSKKSGMPEVRLRDKREKGSGPFGPAALAAYTMPSITKVKS
jgi:hypothetical protein